MKQRFFNPKTGGEVDEPMGQERSMRGFDKAPVAKKPVMKPGSRPLAHHPHDIVGARKKPRIPPKGEGEQPKQVNFDGKPHERPNESPAHEAKESAALERMEKKTGRELSPKHDGKPVQSPTYSWQQPGNSPGVPKKR